MTRTATSRKSLEAWYARMDAASKKPADTPDPNPDGDYWQYGVQSLQIMLKELIGAENYRQWAELVWPADEMERLTWRDMYQQLDRTIEAIFSGTTGLFNWADAAKYGDESVPGSYGL